MSRMSIWGKRLFQCGNFLHMCSPDAAAWMGGVGIPNKIMYPPARTDLSKTKRNETMMKQQQTNSNNGKSSYAFGVWCFREMGKIKCQTNALAEPTDNKTTIHSKSIL